MLRLCNPRPRAAHGQAHEARAFRVVNFLMLEYTFDRPAKAFLPDNFFSSSNARLASLQLLYRTNFHRNFIVYTFALFPIKLFQGFFHPPQILIIAIEHGFLPERLTNFPQQLKRILEAIFGIFNELHHDFFHRATIDSPQSFIFPGRLFKVQIKQHTVNFDLKKRIDLSPGLLTKFYQLLAIPIAK